MPNSVNLATDFDSLAELQAVNFNNITKQGGAPIERGAFNVVGADGSLTPYCYIRGATTGGVAVTGGRLYEVPLAGNGASTIYGAEKIAGETLAAAQTNILIPVGQTYDLIEGDLSLRTDKASAEFPSIVINGDTNSANYDRHSLNGNESNASVIGVAGSQVLFPVGYAGTQVGQFAATRVRIFEPAAARFKIIEIFGFTAYDATNPNDREIRIGSILWKSTAPITSIAFEGGAGDDFQAGSSYLFKGWRDLTISGGGEPYATQELSAASTSAIQFSNIPQTGRHLRFKARLRCDVAAVAVSIYAYVNGDFVDANYHYENLQSRDGVVDSGEELSEPRIGLATGGTAPAGSYADVEIKIDFYSKSAYLVAIKGFSTAYRDTDEIQQTRRTVYSKVSPQAVSSVELRCGSGANFVAGSIVEMYID